MRKIALASILGLLGCSISYVYAAQSGAVDQDIQQLQLLKQVQQANANLNLPNNAPTSGPLTNNNAVIPSNQPITAPPGQQSPSGSGQAFNGQINAAQQMLAERLRMQNQQIAAQNTANQAIVPPPSSTPQNVTGGNNPTVVNGMDSASAGDINEAAFDAVAKNALPMTSEQILRLRQLFNESQMAATSIPGAPPKPVASSQTVNLAPGSTPPVVRLAQGFVSSLVFLDSSGAPWPIEAYDIGNPSAFNIQWNRSDNTLMIQSMTLYTYGNLAVRLKGLATPVMLTLIPGQRMVDYRVDLRVQGYGPNANYAVRGDGLPNAGSDELLGVLDGIPPAGSKMLKIVGPVDCQVWLAGDRMFIRMRQTILSPSWLTTLSSADGMHAYLMPKTPLLLVAQNGKAVHVKVEGF